MDKWKVEYRSYGDGGTTTREFEAHDWEMRGGDEDYFFVLIDEKSNEIFGVPHHAVVCFEVIRDTTSNVAPEAVGS